MPEPKPCPFCGAQPTLRENIYGSGEYLASINCPCINGDVAESYFLRSGETQKQATNKSIAAWNTRTESMPRALTWTTEPPNVEHVGTWFWSKIPGQRMAVPVIVAEVDGVLGIGRGTSEQGLTMETCREFGVKFAGPIPTPLEPGES